MRAITIAKLALLCGPSLLAATVAQAQEPLAAETAADQSADQPAPPADANEAIVVTGSQIQGAKINDVLPVTVLDETAIENTGASSGDELFRAIPQAPSRSTNRIRRPSTMSAATSARSTCATSAPATRCC